MMLLTSLALALLVMASTNAHSPPGVPPPNQQVNHMNVQEGHHGSKLNFKSEIHNADHIIEHLQDVIKTKPKDQMSEEELEFHYFKMHDYDNNNKLDGVEIGKALTHFHEDQHPHGDGSDPEAAAKRAAKAKELNEKIYTDEDISNLVEKILEMFDKNTDGYMDYVEFKLGQLQLKTEKDV